jgi:hypothetical protein
MNIKYSDLIILSIIWIVSIYSIISLIENSYEIGIQNYIGYGLLIVITILRFFRIRRFKTILGFFLIVGSTNLIQFTCSTHTFVVKRIMYTYGIQPLSFILLFLLILSNLPDFKRLKSDFFPKDPKITEDRRKRIAAEFYDELKHEKDSTLQEIIKNKNTYQNDYVNEAQKLIDERKKTHYNKHKP